MASKVVQVYVATHCGPCHEVKEILEDGGFTQSHGDSVDVIDVETEEGFEKLSEAGASVDGVPSAYYEGRKCRILVDKEEGTLHIECPSSDPES